jgi:transcriptional regulator with GAF, ATPase, and Fis domain
VSAFRLRVITVRLRLNFTRMTGGRLVLSDFVPAVRASVDVEAFGVVLARPDRQTELVTRHRAGVAAHLLPADRLPLALARTGGATTIITPLHEHHEAAHPLFDRLVRYGIDCLLVMPLPGGEGLFWTGKRGAMPFTDREVAAFAAVTDDLVAAMREPEPPDTRLARLARLDAVEQMLLVIAGALDVRDVFHRLSDIARAVLPHDAASIQILSDDLTRVRVYALDGIPRTEVPEEFATDYAPVFNEHYLFSLHDDLLASPAERARPAAKAGRRSALRLPLRFDGRVGGALEFSSTAVAAYRETDVDVARRIAEFVTLALAHQRMAEDAHHAAALRERADNLVMLDELLATLSGVLDVREVLDRVSVIAQRVLRHDAMAVTIIIARGAPPPRGDAFARLRSAYPEQDVTDGAPPAEQRIRVHALSGFADFPPFFEAPLPEPELMTEPWDFRIIDDMAADPRYAASPTVRAGMRSVLGLPVRFEGRLHYGVNFYSRSTAAFTRDDALVGRRIADHVALALSHQRLAEASRSNAELKVRTANLELLDELLAAMTDAGPLGELFDRVSAVAKKVIPHDAMTVPMLLSEGTPMPEEFRRDDTWEYDVIDEAAQRPEPFNQQLAASGYHSALRVPIRLDGRLAAGLAFMSHAPGVYTAGNVLAARRIAERFALCLSRERGAAASKRADEAAARASQLESRVRALADELDARTGYRRVIGQSAKWRQVLTQAAQVAPTDTTVLLLGESGTGKEVVARFVHRASARRDGPFIALNCAALPEQLLEAELFGYERGAFTGATQSKPGQLEQASGGTLFLDEVGEMSLAVQVKLLRVLQEREFQRLGGMRVLRTDARVVAATNRDLQQAIAHGRFREDLFYRLNVFAIHLPPLRDRRDDVVPLCDAFLVEFGRSLGRPPAGLSRDARQRLMDYHWPGNVRELRNILERAAILCDGGLITADHLALTVAPLPPVEMAPQPLAATTTSTSPAGDLNAMERSMIEQALQAARFNKSKAAQALGLTRAQLYVRMRKHGLE